MYVCMYVCMYVAQEMRATEIPTIIDPSATIKCPIATIKCPSATIKCPSATGSIIVGISYPCCVHMLICSYVIILTYTCIDTPIRVYTCAYPCMYTGLQLWESQYP